MSAEERHHGDPSAAESSEPANEPRTARSTGARERADVDDDIRSVVEDLASEVESLRSEVQQLRDEKADLEAKVSELETENEQLRESHEELTYNTVTKSTTNFLIDWLTGTEADHYTAEIEERKDDVTSFHSDIEEMREDVRENKEVIDDWGDGETSDREEAWYQTVQAARNLAGNPKRITKDGNRVILYADDLDTVLSYTYRYCVDLLETWGKEKQGATWKPHVPATAGENNEEHRKRLIIDMEVWGEE